LLSAAVAASLLAAAPARPTPKPSPSGWLDGNRIRLTVSPKVGGAAVTYGFTIAANGDMRIEVEDRSGKEGASGEMLLVSSRFLATRGLKLPKDYEVDALDAAALSWQLAARLLERGAPGDPGRAARTVRISVVEREKPLTVGTTSGEETFPPPWSVEGRASPLGDGRVYFEIVFASRTSAPPPSPTEVAMRYSGTWERLSPAPAIPDGTSLSGWTLYALGQYRRKTSQGSIIDYGATPVAERYATVGDLRRAAAAGK
jgi:hypothetical protein